MAYSVLTQAWLPVRMTDGTVRKIAPWQIAEDSVVDIVHSRPDLNGAARELVIGLLQILYPPATEDEKVERIVAPPSPDDLRAAFTERADLFELVDGPSRFLQEHGGVKTDDARPIDNLLLNGPGEQTRKLHKDFFVRRDQTNKVCPDCVILMLMAKQAYASGTGPGFRVSPRGGGPLTTLLEVTDDAGEPVSLWASLYLNVMPLSLLGVDGLNDGNASRILPWLAPLRVSKVGKADVQTTTDHAHPLQVFFPAPARIEMVWENGAACHCDICGGKTEQYATGWKTAQYGVLYVGLEHPLTPYRIGKDGERLTLKPKSGAISYADWMAVTLGAEGKLAPAQAIQSAKDILSSIGHAVRVRAFGYHLENASAMAWHEAIMPFVDVPDEVRSSFIAEVSLMVEAARETANALVSHVKQALYDRPGDLGGDLSHIHREFIAGTTSAFYDTLPSLIDGIKVGDTTLVKQEWLKIIQAESLRLFERHAPVQVAEERNLERLVRAHRKFASLMRSSWIMKILDLPVAKKEAA